MSGPRRLPSVLGLALGCVFAACPASTTGVTRGPETDAPTGTPTPPIDAAAEAPREPPAVVGAARFAVAIPASEPSSPDGAPAAAELQIYVADARGLTLEARLALPPRRPMSEDLALGGAPLSFAWRTSDELALLFEDGALATVRDGVMGPLARPSLFQVPRTELGRHRGEVPRDLRPRDRELVVDADGELWIAHCAWYACGDEQCACEHEVYVRVGAEPRASRERPVVRALPTPPAPVGASLDLAFEPAPPSDERFGRLSCGLRDRAPWVNTRASDNDFGVRAAGWVASDPPIAWLDRALGGADRLSIERCLLRDCGALECLPPVPSAIDPERGLALGPAGFWARLLPDDAGIEVLWQGRSLGRVARATVARFAAAP